jgi:hypothetical protein
MRRRSVAVLSPPEYPRPVLPSGLTDDQQDELLDRMMTQLMTGCPDRGVGGPLGVEVRVVSGGAWSLDDDVVEF